MLGLPGGRVRAGLISLWRVAHKFRGHESYEAGNHHDDAKNKHPPVRPGAAEFDTHSPKIKSVDHHNKKKSHSDKPPVDKSTIRPDHWITSFSSRDRRGLARRIG
jgi:hypothetical protein